MYNAEFLKSAYRPDQFVADKGVEVAFAGRSNVGKSSAINTITERKSLARASRTPGRTQLINFFELAPGRRLVDLPGYGYARVPESLRRHWRGLMDAYFTSRRSLSGLMLIMDVRRPLTDYDWLMLDLMSNRELRTHILLTKADKVSRGAGAASLHQVRKEVPSGAVSAQLFSALKRTGVEEAREALERLLNR